MTSRIYEYQPTSEAVVVQRVLVMTHKAIDDHFPGASKASRKFTKTVFSDAANESTVADRAPSEHAQSSESWAQGGSGEGGNDSMLPETKDSQRIGRAKARRPDFESRPERIFSEAPASLSDLPSDSGQAMTIGQNQAEKKGQFGQPPSQTGRFGQNTHTNTVKTTVTDWTLRVAMVALVLGLIALAVLSYFS